MNFPTEKNIQNSKLLILNNISSNRRCLVQQIKNVRNKQKHYQLKAKINIAVHKKDSNSTTQQLKSTIRSVPTLQLKALLHSEAALAPKGALYVMMLYYISQQLHFFKFFHYICIESGGLRDR